MALSLIRRWYHYKTKKNFCCPIIIGVPFRVDQQTNKLDQNDSVYFVIRILSAVTKNISEKMLVVKHPESNFRFKSLKYIFLTRGATLFYCDVLI